MITQQNKPVKFIFIIFSFLSLSSCTSSRLLGSWEFIDLYDGVVTEIDTLKSKENNSKYGTGTLTFNKDNFFISMEESGSYQRKNKTLKMKYPAVDTVVMNISYESKNYLLLSAGKDPKTWFYRKK
ncbi:hypothetical protein [Chryseobacterium herbae]|uniref:Lipocalin-like domain-containing protein n=1 Tax=Chryseobacterium herbae TaxID=2976476 RepID=A0ABT2IZQ0_9FLAO|nr:hypothetical protein [Chryseobacterium sp. pc1-10]MCT2564307.1 hypothetical protein [Chryseobacterium sp. pc1-10]